MAQSYISTWLWLLHSDIFALHLASLPPTSSCPMIHFRFLLIVRSRQFFFIQLYPHTCVLPYGLCLFLLLISVLVFFNISIHYSKYLFSLNFIPFFYSTVLPHLVSLECLTTLTHHNYFIYTYILWKSQEYSKLRFPHSYLFRVFLVLTASFSGHTSNNRGITYILVQNISAILSLYYPNRKLLDVFSYITIFIFIIFSCTLFLSRTLHCILLST